MIGNGQGRFSTHDLRHDRRTRSSASKHFVVSLTIAILFVGLLLIIPILFPFDSNATNLSSANKAPGTDGFLLGSDAVGRDVLLRTIAGGSESIPMAFAVVIIAFLIGSVMGLIAGFAGGKIDYVIDKIITTFQAFPSFVLAIAIAAVLGPGVVNMVIAISVVYWTQPARLARNLAMSLRESPSAKAAIVCGAGPRNICVKYILPNMVAPLIVMAMLSIGDVILTMAGLSFIGLGPERPTNEWGAMMSEARTNFQFAPWNILVPGVALFCAVTIFNMLGDSLRDVLDVKSRRQENSARSDSERRGRKQEKGRSMKARSKRKGLLGGVVAVALTGMLLLAGCASSASSSSASSAPETQSAKTLKAGSNAYFYNETLDPAYNWDGWELEYYGVAENLLKLTDDYQIEPWLAESVDNVDDYTWKINLRDDVVFSNGEKMTAESVKDCWNRTYEVNSRAVETLPLESIDTDGQTLTIKTTAPVPSFKNVICDPLFCIYYTEDGIDYEKDGTATTGPYKVEDFVFEDHIYLVPNENYWDGEPQLSRVELNTYLDNDAMTMALQNGEIDIIAMPPTSSITTVANDDRFQVLSSDSTRADFVRFNMKHPVVANAAVREAISYCIDRDGYADVICAGMETPSYGVYSAVLPYGGTAGLDVTVDKFSPDDAKAVLDQAGVVDANNDGVRELPDGTPCEINLYNCSSYERFVRLGDDLQSKLDSIGIKLNIIPVDYWLQDFETYDNDDPDMTIDSYGMAPTGDANYFASMCFATDGSANFGRYSNQTVDELIGELKSTFDQNERDEIAKQISQQVLNDNAYVFFGNSQTSYVGDKSVQNIAVAPSEYYFITKDTTIG